MARQGTGRARRAVTAFFDDRAAAQQAVDDLAAAGVARDRITLVEGGGATPVESVPVPSADRGIWATVKDLFMADEDRHAYGEGLRRGGVLLSVMTDGGDDARVVEVLDREGAVDMDARQGDWELEGWDPARASADLAGLATPAAEAPVGTPLPSDAIHAALAPAAAVGPALATHESPNPGRRTVVRDLDAEGLRLRSYVESQKRLDTMG